MQVTMQVAMQVLTAAVNPVVVKLLRWTAIQHPPEKPKFKFKSPILGRIANSALPSITESLHGRPGQPHSMALMATNPLYKR